MLGGCWEEFEDGPTEARETRMHVTLSHRNVIHLNGNVMERLGKPEFVRLLFDRFNSRIGIMPTHKSAPNAFPLKVKGRGRHRIIWAAPFCKYYGIHFDRIRAFVDPEIDADNVLTSGFRSGEGGDHPTQKPVRLLQSLIELTTLEGQIVFDPFAGSGSTLVAAKMLDRHFLGFESDDTHFSTAELRLAKLDYQNSLF